MPTTLSKRCGWTGAGAGRVTGLLSFALGAGWLSAAEVDISKLPPPAKVTIDFNRDIKPILDNSCLRCHGPEKPKSGFRLDNKESALKGGDNGPDVLPGDSAKSPLIHYVAFLVEDMEMPPPGKGDKLTPEQVGLLRAWIDQGVTWGDVVQPPAFEFSATPFLRYLSVSGDENKFREHWGMKEGWGWGLEEFSLRQRLDDRTKVSVDGHVSVEDNDYGVRFNLERRDLGFWRGGFSDYRRFYDDSGGYYRGVIPSSVELDRDLQLEVGRIWTEVGLTLPRWPLMVLGYEYRFRDGEKATTHWGGVGGKKIYPAPRVIDEHSHLIRLDLSYENHGWLFEDNVRLEFHEYDTSRRDVTYTLGPVADALTVTREGTKEFIGVNTFRVEKQLKANWRVAGGHLYSHVDADASFDQATLNGLGVPGVYGTFWYSDRLVLDQDTHVFSFSSMWGPWKGWTLSGAVQDEWMRQEGLGRVHLDEGDPNVPAFFGVFPAVLDSDIDKHALNESLSLRYSGLKFTSLYLDSRFQQEEISQFERQAGGPTPFLRDTDASSHWSEHRFGFHTVPWRRFSLSGWYKRKDRISDYDHDRDVSVTGPGYSAFITDREIEGNEVETKLTWKAASWWRATLGYRWVGTDYETSTKAVVDPFGTISTGGGTFAGNYDAHTWSLHLSGTPHRRIYLSGTASFSNARTVTGDNHRPEVTAYTGNIYSVLASASYVLSEKTDATLSYLFSRSDFGQDNLDGLPLGLDYTRHGVLAGLRHQFNKTVSARWQYGYFQYREPSLNHASDYEAHGLFATLSLRWP